MTTKEYYHSAYAFTMSLEVEDKAELLKHAKMFNELRKLRKQNEDKG